MTCAKRPGGLGYEEMDALDYASWGVDYLKYDNCYNTGVPAFDRYNAMASALQATGRDIFYSICNWGNENVAKWGYTISNSWRTTQDIEIYYTQENQWQQIKGNFLINQLSSSVAGPGHWNDPDMLQIGNGVLTTTDEKSHFALWAFAKAPLIIGCDLTTMSSESLDILMNKNMIAINQNSKSLQARCIQGCDEGLSYHIYQTQIFE